MKAHPRRNVEKIPAAARRLTGKQDLSSFVVERASSDDSVLTIFRIDVPELGPFCRLTFVGDGFLHRML